MGYRRDAKWNATSATLLFFSEEYKFLVLECSKYTCKIIVRIHKKKEKVLLLKSEALPSLFIHKKKERKRFDFEGKGCTAERQGFTCEGKGLTSEEKYLLANTRFYFSRIHKEKDVLRI